MAVSGSTPVAANGIISLLFMCHIFFFIHPPINGYQVASMSPSVILQWQFHLPSSHWAFVSELTSFCLHTFIAYQPRIFSWLPIQWLYSPPKTHSSLKCCWLQLKENLIRLASTKRKYVISHNQKSVIREAPASPYSGSSRLRWSQPCPSAGLVLMLVEDSYSNPVPLIQTQYSPKEEEGTICLSLLLS